MAKKIRTSYEEAYKINKEGGVRYSQYGGGQVLEEYKLIIWNSEDRVWDFYDNDNPPIVDYQIVINSRKSCGMVKKMNSEPAFIEKIILICETENGYLKGIFLETNMEDENKMSLFEWTVVCFSLEKTAQLLNKIASLFCIGAFGENMKIVEQATKLLEMNKTDEQEEKK